VSWILASALVLAVALAAGFAWYEREHPTTRVLALVATLAALAALGRVAFAPLPNVKPTTDIVLLSGFALGGAPGFAVGAVAALGSNLVFGQGPWTPWQMAGWGLVGVTAAALGPALRNRPALALYGLAAGFLFDWLMDVWAWSSLGGGSTSFIALASTGIWFDVAHAAGNVLLAVVAGPTLIRMLDRYARKLHGTFVPLEQT
jgi:energy-coupling factor transport system substrate-specific component